MRDMAPHYEAVKAELLKQPGILAVTRSNQNIVSYRRALPGDFDWDGKDQNLSLIMHPIVVDKDFISFFKMKMVQGASFTGAPK